MHPLVYLFLFVSQLLVYCSAFRGNGSNRLKNYFRSAGIGHGKVYQKGYGFYGKKVFKIDKKPGGLAAAGELNHINHWTRKCLFCNTAYRHRLLISYTVINDKIIV